ncbi:MAG: hypothetical protein NW226_13990 [Microscillaceae bacterium]|nr:hypothetical protein [Microscillaceae bacterium]
MEKLDRHVNFFIINKKNYEEKYIPMEEKIIDNDLDFTLGLINQMLLDIENNILESKIPENEYIQYNRHFISIVNEHGEISSLESKKEFLIKLKQKIIDDEITSSDKEELLVDLFLWSSLEFFSESWYSYPSLLFSKGFTKYLYNTCDHFKLIINDLDYLEKFNISFRNDELLDWRVLNQMDVRVLLENFIINDDFSTIPEGDIQLNYYKKFLEMSFNDEVIILLFYLY